jgi:hypothetical protein
MFVTSEGSPYARFRRALGRGDLAGIALTSRELRRVPLRDALRIVVLMQEADDERFERAAARWVARFVLEVRAVGIQDARRAVDALDRLPDETAQQSLSALCAEFGIS